MELTRVVVVGTCTQSFSVQVLYLQLLHIAIRKIPKRDSPKFDTFFFVSKMQRGCCPHDLVLNNLQHSSFARFDNFLTTTFGLFCRMLKEIAVRLCLHTAENKTGPVSTKRTTPSSIRGKEQKRETAWWKQEQSRSKIECVEPFAQTRLRMKEPEPIYAKRRHCLANPRSFGKGLEMQLQSQKKSSEM